MDLKKLNLQSIKNILLGTKGIITMAVVFGLTFIIVLIVQSCTPQNGSLIYGICKGFLEQQIAFPHTLTYTNVEQYPKAVRIYYTHVDSYGQYQFELIECSFVQDPKNGVQLDKVYFNNIKPVTKAEQLEGKGRLYGVRKEVIDLFNKSQSASAIMSQDPDLSLPSKQRMKF